MASQPAGVDLWGRRPPPEPSGRAVRIWTWPLAASSDITNARGQLRELLRWAGTALPPAAEEADVDRLLLTFEELASNGLRHGRPPVHVRVVASTEEWLIDVVDTGVDRPPTPAVGRDPADGGLGLYLIARLCPAHGWWLGDGHKQVWACVRPASR